MQKVFCQQKQVFQSESISAENWNYLFKITTLRLLGFVYQTTSAPVLLLRVCLRGQNPSYDAPWIMLPQFLSSCSLKVLLLWKCVLFVGGKSPRHFNSDWDWNILSSTKRKQIFCHCSPHASKLEQKLTIKNKFDLHSIFMSSPKQTPQQSLCYSFSEDKDNSY